MMDASMSCEVSSSWRPATPSHFFKSAGSMKSSRLPSLHTKKKRPCFDAKQGLFYAAQTCYFPFFAYFFLNRSTRPSVSTIFCVPVKNGWQFEQISTLMSPTVDRVLNELPQAQWTVASRY